MPLFQASEQLRQDTPLGQQVERPVLAVARFQVNACGRLELGAAGHQADPLPLAVGPIQAVSARTVEGYRASIMRKVGAKSASELVRRVLDRGGAG